MRSVSGRPARPGNAIVTAGHPVPRVPSAPGAPSRSGAPKPLTRNCVRAPVQGYAPLVTGDHRELSRLIGTERPRLILLDLMLPDADGIELMQNVPELADQPVIFISAYGRDETSAQEGADDSVHRRNSPLQQGPAGRPPAARGKRHAHPHRRDDGKPLLRGHRAPALPRARIRAGRLERRARRRAAHPRPGR